MSSSLNNKLLNNTNNTNKTDNSINNTANNTANNTTNNTNNNTNTVKKKNRRPGRPRKNPIKKSKPRNGISKTPSMENNYIEFIYDKPIILKKMAQFFKLMAVEKLQIIFQKDKITFWAKDHHMKNKILITINANKLNHYYCHSKTDIGLICKDLELILYKIDKTYTSVCIVSQKGYTQKNLLILLKNEIDIDERHQIEIIGSYPKLHDESIFYYNKFCIKFNLPGKYFKKMITDIKSFSDVLSICQHEKGDPLKFEYVTRNKKIKSTNIVNNKNTINFISNLKDDDSFRISFVVDYVKPISSSTLSDIITLYCNESQPLLFIIKADDETFEARILTEIIDDRIV